MDVTIEQLLMVVEHMRRETGNPYWPFEPNFNVKSPKALAEQEANIQITVAMRHNIGSIETDARLRKAEQLALQAENDYLAKQARKRRTGRARR